MAAESFEVAKLYASFSIENVADAVEKANREVAASLKDVRVGVTVDPAQLAKVREEVRKGLENVRLDVDVRVRPESRAALSALQAQLTRIKTKAADPVTVTVATKAATQNVTRLADALDRLPKGEVVVAVRTEGTIDATANIEKVRAALAEITGEHVVRVRVAGDREAIQRIENLGARERGGDAKAARERSLSELGERPTTTSHTGGPLYGAALAGRQRAQAEYDAKRERVEREYLAARQQETKAAHAAATGAEDLNAATAKAEQAARAERLLRSAAKLSEIQRTLGLPETEMMARSSRRRNELTSLDNPDDYKVWESYSQSTKSRTFVKNPHEDRYDKAGRWPNPDYDEAKARQWDIDHGRRPRDPRVDGYSEDNFHANQLKSGRVRADLKDYYQREAVKDEEKLRRGRLSDADWKTENRLVAARDEKRNEENYALRKAREQVLAEVAAMGGGQLDDRAMAEVARRTHGDALVVPPPSQAVHDLYDRKRTADARAGHAATVEEPLRPGEVRVDVGLLEQLQQEREGLLDPHDPRLHRALGHGHPPTPAGDDGLDLLDGGPDAHGHDGTKAFRVARERAQAEATTQIEAAKAEAAAKVEAAEKAAKIEVDRLRDENAVLRGDAASATTLAHERVKDETKALYDTLNAERAKTAAAEERAKTAQLDAEKARAEAKRLTAEHAKAAAVREKAPAVREKAPAAPSKDPMAGRFDRDGNFLTKEDLAKRAAEAEKKDAAGAEAEKRIAAAEKRAAAAEKKAEQAQQRAQAASERARKAAESAAKREAAAAEKVAKASASGGGGKPPTPPKPPTAIGGTAPEPEQPQHSGRRRMTAAEKAQREAAVRELRDAQRAQAVADAVNEFDPAQGLEKGDVRESWRAQNVRRHVTGMARETANPVDGADLETATEQARERFQRQEEARQRRTIHDRVYGGFDPERFAAEEEERKAKRYQGRYRLWARNAVRGVPTFSSILAEEQARKAKEDEAADREARRKLVEGGYDGDAYQAELEEKKSRRQAGRDRLRARQQVWGNATYESEVARQQDLYDRSETAAARRAIKADVRGPFDAEQFRADEERRLRTEQAVRRVAALRASLPSYQPDFAARLDEVGAMHDDLTRRTRAITAPHDLRRAARTYTKTEALLGRNPFAPTNLASRAVAAVTGGGGGTTTFQQTQQSLDGFAQKAFTVDRALKQMGGRWGFIVGMIGAGVPVITAAAGALLALGTAGGALLGGLGAAAIGFSGIKKAITEKATAKSQQTPVAQYTAHQQRLDASHAVDNAYVDQAVAARNAAIQQVQDARSVVSAQEKLADVLKSNYRSSLTTKESLTDAYAAEKRAVYDLNEATKQRIRLLEDQQRTAQAAYLSTQGLQYQAVQDREDAAKAQYEYDTGQINNLALAQARNKAASSLNAFDQSTVDTARLGQDQAQQSAGQDSTAQAVLSAQQSVTAAMRGIRQAQWDAADAVVQASRDQRDAINQLADAQQSQRNNAADAATAAVRAAQAVQDAQAQLVATMQQTDVILGKTDKWTERTYAAMGPAGRALIDKITNVLTPAYRKMRESIQEAMTPGLNKVADDFVKYSPQITKVASKLGGAVATELGKGADALGTNPAWTKLWDLLGTKGPGYIQQWGTIFGSSITGVISLMEKLEPLGQRIVNKIEDGARAFAGWSAGSGGDSFVGWMMQHGPTVAKLVGEIVVDLADIAKKFSGTGWLSPLSVLESALNTVSLAPSWLVTLGTELATMSAIFGGLSGFVGGIAKLGSIVVGGFASAKALLAMSKDLGGGFEGVKKALMYRNTAGLTAATPMHVADDVVRAQLTELAGEIGTLGAAGAAEGAAGVAGAGAAGAAGAVGAAEGAAAASNFGALEAQMTAQGAFESRMVQNARQIEEMTAASGAMGAGWERTTGKLGKVSGALWGVAKWAGPVAAVGAAIYGVSQFADQLSETTQAAARDTDALVSSLKQLGSSGKDGTGMVYQGELRKTFGGPQGVLNDLKAQKPDNVYQDLPGWLQSTNRFADNVVDGLKGTHSQADYAAQLQEYNQAVADLKANQDALVQLAQQGDPAVAQFAQSLKDVGANQGQVNDALGEKTITAMNNYIGENTYVMDSLGHLKNSFGDTYDAASALADMFDRLNGKAMSESEAADTYSRKIDSLAESFAQNGAALQGNSVEALNNRDAVREAIKSAEAYAQSVADQTGDVNKGIDKAQELKNQIIQQGVQAGYSKQQISDMVGQLFKVPDHLTVGSSFNPSGAIDGVNAYRTATGKNPPTVTFGSRLDLSGVIAGAQKFAGQAVGPVGSGAAKIAAAVPIFHNRYGSINVEHFAAGGITPLPGQAVLAKDGANLYNWAEAGTGGEAFIPLGDKTSARSKGMVAWLGNYFGLQAKQQLSDRTAISGALSGMAGAYGAIAAGSTHYNNTSTDNSQVNSGNVNVVFNGQTTDARVKRRTAAIAAGARARADARRG